MATKITEELQLILKANYDGAKNALERYEELVKNAEEATDDLSSAQEKCSEASEAAEKSQNEQSESLSNLITKYTKFVAVGALAIKTYKAIMEAGEAANVANARASAMIEATGRSGDVTMSSLKRMSADLMKETGYSTTEIVNASARMLTALDADSEHLKQYMSLAADLSALWGTDLSSSAKTLAEILAKPTEGISKLKSQGIFLDETLVSNITHLEQMGNTASAQELIVKALGDRIGETAEKINDSKSNWTQLKTVMSEIVSYMGENFAGSDFGNWLTNGLIEGLDRKKSLDYVTGFLSDLRTDSVKALSGLSISDIDFIEAFFKDFDHRDRIAQQKLFGSLGIKNSENYSAAVENVTQALEGARSELEANARAQAALNEVQSNGQKVSDSVAGTIKADAEATANLLSLYATTSEGQLAAMETQLASLEKQRSDDRKINKAEEGEYTYNQISEATTRLKMYDSVIGSLQDKIDKLKKSGNETVKPVIDKILGVSSAKDYVLNIPIGLVWADKPEETELKTLQAQLAAVKSAAESLYSAGPDKGDTGQWQSALDKLIAKYGEISGKIDGINEKTKEIDRAKELLNSLLTEEEKKQNRLAELEKLKKDELLTQAQYEQLKMGIIGKELTEQEKISEIIKEQSKGLLSLNSISQASVQSLTAIGNALASGANAGNAALDSIGSYISSLATQISTSSIAAGMRIIAETGWAGVPTALALFAVGGVTGIGAGLMGGSKGIDSSITDSMEKELKAREALAEQINSSIDEEYLLLKRQLERNMISVDDFRSQASEMQDRRDFNAAVTETSSAAMARVRELDSELSSMSGWNRFWTYDDEAIENKVSRIKALYDEIDNEISKARLEQILQQLKALGVDTSGIPKFAKGGSFMTNGPQLILVGDNPSGREMVDIRPVGAGETALTGQNINIRVDTAYGIEDLYGKLEMAALKMGRRRA